jgi:hypothetical protein
MNKLWHSLNVVGVINRVISPVEKLTKGVKRIMDGLQSKNLLDAIMSGNGAKVAIALYIAGVDIKLKNVNRSFSGSIPFQRCAKVVNDSYGRSRESVLELLDLEARCADVFTHAWDSASDERLGKQAQKEYAIQAESDYRAQEMAKMGVHPLAKKSTPVSTLPATDRNHIKPFNPSSAIGKPLPGIETPGYTFQYEGGKYKVEKQNAGKGDWRVKLTGGRNVFKSLEGKSVTLAGKEYRIVKAGETWFNALPVGTVQAEFINDSTPPVQESDIESRVNKMESLLEALAEKLL